MNKIIGLTGGYCAGKNQAASVIGAMGWEIVDVDRLGYKALEVCAERLSEAFGPEILKSDGTIDRKTLGAIVFSDPERLRLHESIVHPVMLGFLDEAIAAHPKVCINAALLYRFPQKDRCALIIEVRAPLGLRIQRGRVRDGLGVIDILKRIASQRPLWELRPRERPPVIVVDNKGDLGALKAGVEKALAPLSST